MKENRKEFPKELKRKITSKVNNKIDNQEGSEIKILRKNDIHNCIYCPHPCI